MTRQIMLITVVILLAGCASSQPKDISGFSGYAFGSEYSFILEDMRAEGREPEELTNAAQWYDGELEGYRVEFAYLFENELLVSGFWVFQDTSLTSFQSIEDLLLRTYSSSVVRRTDNGVATHEHHGPDTRILHILDPSEPRHAVHYYFAADPVAEQAARR